MTPKTWEAIDAAIAELSALSTEAFRERMAGYGDAPLTLCFKSLSAFAENLAATFETRHKVNFGDFFVQWGAAVEYEKFVVNAANDDRYLLAA